MMKDRKKMAAELHHRKQEGNGTSMIFGRKVPVIKEVYDPLTGLRNGTITPNAPVVITGENLCLSSLGTIYLGLSPVSDKGTLIHVKRVFKYTDHDFFYSPHFTVRDVVQGVHDTGCSGLFDIPQADGIIRTVPAPGLFT